MSGTLRLRGSTSGYSELQAPAVAADQTFVLPTAGGTLLTTDSPVPKLTLELGSASQPSLTFQGDTDTGLFSEGTNTLNLVTGGSSKVVLGADAHTIYAGTGATVRAIDIDSSGRVGIGTTAPGSYSGASTKLSIAATGNSGLNIVSGTSNTGIIRFADGTSGDAAYRGRVEYMHDVDALMFGTAGDERMRIDSSGMHTITASNNSTAVQIRDASNYAGQLITATDGTFEINARTTTRFTRTGSASESMRIDSSGRVGFGVSTMAGGAGSLTIIRNSALRWADSDGTQRADIYGDASSNLVFRNGTGSTERMRITSTGNAEFTGQVKADSISGAFQASRSDGAANHVFRGGTSTSNYTSVITANGQLTLSGTSGAFQATRSDGAANHIFRAGTSTSNYTTVITAGGAATFAGVVEGSRFINATDSADPWLKGVNGSGTETLFIKKDGTGYLTKLGIGDSSPNTNLVVKGASNSLTNSVGNINVISTDSAAINAGGSIGLGGFYNGTSNSIPFANLHGKKENGTNNNAAGYFAISTRNASSGTAERMRIDSSGRLLLNDSSVGTQRIDAPLQIETGSSGNAINLRARSSDNAYSYINFTSNDNNQVSASIHLLRNASNNEGSLIFSTTKGGDTVPTEQLTINSIGRMSGQAVNINRAFTLLLARLESHGGCSPGGPSGTFTEFDSGERSFTTVSRTTTTAPTNYVFFGDGYGNAFTLFVGCGDNPVFGTSVAANDAGTYRSWICIHEDFTSAISGLPTNATRTSLP